MLNNYVLIVCLYHNILIFMVQQKNAYNILQPVCIQVIQPIYHSYIAAHI